MANDVKQKTLLSWSSGKDCAWALHVLRQHPEVEVVGLLTTFNENFNRVAMHGVPRALVEKQAEATGLPLFPIMLPWPCSNADYEARMQAALDGVKQAGVTSIAFGDLHLADVRAYREQQLAGTGVQPVFPLWGTSAATPGLARTMLAFGMRAVLTCVDPKQLPESFVGREYDETLLADLPAEVDPCGERGEFHTFCYAGPMFNRSIAVETGQRVLRDNFWFADLLPR